MIENFSNYWFKQFKAASNGRLLKVYNHFVQIDEVGDDILFCFTVLINHKGRLLATSLLIKLVLAQATRLSISNAGLHKDMFNYIFLRG